MKTNILFALSDVAELSSGARQISERLLARYNNQGALEATAGSDDGAILAAELRSKIDMLDLRVRQLSEQIEDANDVDLTDDQMVRFKLEFANRIAGTAHYQLAVAYDVGYFRTLPRAVRPLIASVLVQVYESKGLMPMALWQKLSLSDGAL